MRQHASSSPNHTPTLPTFRLFFSKGALRAPLTDQPGRRRPSSSCTSTEAATRGLPSLCRPTVRLLRSKHRLAARYSLCTPAKLLVCMPLDARCATTYVVHLVASMCWLPFAAGFRYFECGGCNGHGFNGDECRWLTVTSKYYGSATAWMGPCAFPDGLRPRLRDRVAPDRDCRGAASGLG